MTAGTDKTIQVAGSPRRSRSSPRRRRDHAAQVVDDADDAAVALAATIFQETGCDDLIAFDDFADWYTEGGFRVASWLELLDLSKWVL